VTKHVVGFSGGIDSQAVARWVLNRCPPQDVILLNSDAGGNEHPMTSEFVAWYSANVHPVVVIQALISDLGGTGERSAAIEARRDEFSEDEPLTFDGLAYIKGRFPSRTAQFCTEFLKLKPALRWIQDNLSGQKIIRYTGVRRDESKKRSQCAIEFRDASAGCPMIAPIADWTKQMCFDYVKLHGEKINELYTLGFDRVGCAPCVNSGKDDVLAWVQRFPAMIDKVRGWEQRVGKTFFSPCVPGMEINWIDDVVAWAKTVRGGKQFGLHVLYERPACESIYGLCE